MSTASHAAAPPARPVMEPVPVQIRSVVKETHDTFTLTVAPPPGDPIAAFEPGQFSMLYVFGVGELPISISGDPAVRDSLTYTIRSVGQVTYQLVTRRPGDYIGVRGPLRHQLAAEGSARQERAHRRRRHRPGAAARRPSTRSCATAATTTGW